MLCVIDDWPGVVEVERKGRLWAANSCTRVNGVEAAVGNIACISEMPRGGGGAKKERVCVVFRRRRRRIMGGAIVGFGGLYK